jgi:hypothetical protein
MRETSISGGGLARRTLLGMTILLGVAIAFPMLAAAKGKSTVALWVANGTDVVEFLPSAFSKGTHDKKPHRILNSMTGFGARQGVVFGTGGNLWVIDGGTTAVGGTAVPALDEFTPTQLTDLKKKKDKTPTRNVTLISTASCFRSKGCSIPPAISG